MTIRIEFPPALMTRELAAYYISGSLRDIDALKAQGELIPVGDTKRIKFRREDLDRYVADLPERKSGCWREGGIRHDAVAGTGVNCGR